MKKIGDSRKIKETVKVCRFFYNLAYQERKRYIYIIVITIFTLALSPFIGIIFPKEIIECLLLGENKRAYYLVAAMILGGFLLESFKNILDEERTKDEDWIARKYEMMISQKSMDMKFVNTETEKSIEAEKKAETGMSWYSGGIKGISDCIITIASSIISFIGVSYLINKISFVLIVIVIMSVAVNTLVISKINGAQQEVFEKTPKINKFYSYIYQRIILREFAKELRIYDGTNLVEEKAISNAKQLNEMDNACAVKQIRWSTLGACVNVITYGGVYCFMGIMAIDGKIGIGDLVMSITAIDTLSNNCLNKIVQGFQSIFMKSGFMKSFIDFMSLEDSNDTGTCLFKDKNCFDIEFRNVYFRYPGTKEYIFEDFSLKISDKEKISIVGMNGAGKTTLVKLLCRLYEVESGEILVNGVNIQDYEYDQYINSISVVFQDFKLFSLPLKENIAVGDCDNDEKSIQDSLRIAGLNKWVDRLRAKENTLLFKDYDENGVDPSGGEMQKIAIARAVNRHTPLIILDEPTAALDPMAEYEVYNSFNEMINNKTCIYISHRLSSCKFCDKIVVFADKGIAESGTHAELMHKNGIYKKMYDTQAEWYKEA